MLTITINGAEYWNSKTNEFEYSTDTVLTLEHSLVSISKWESRWHKSFFLKEGKTSEETLDYIKMMTITQNVPDNVYLRLSTENLQDINNYITNPMTATTITRQNSKKTNAIITSEIIYSWMIALQIPVDFQKWHINRLLTLIEVCNENNKPPENLSPAEVAKRNSALNAARKKKYNTKG